MFYQHPNDDKEIATEWGLIKDPQRDNPLVSRHTRRLQKSPSLTWTTTTTNILFIDKKWHCIAFNWFQSILVPEKFLQLNKKKSFGFSICFFCPDATFSYLGHLVAWLVWGAGFLCRRLGITISAGLRHHQPSLPLTGGQPHVMLKHNKNIREENSESSKASASALKPPILNLCTWNMMKNF